MNFSMPEVPVKNSKELNELAETRRVGSACYETIRSLSIALVKLTSVIENTEEAKLLKRDPRHLTVLGFLSKCLRLQKSVLQLDSQSDYGETVELICYHIHKDAINGMFYIESSDDVYFNGFLKDSLRHFAHAYKSLRVERETSKNAEFMCKQFETYCKYACLDPNGTFDVSVKPKSLIEKLGELGLGQTVIESNYRTQLQSVKNDFVFCVTKMIREVNDIFLFNTEKLTASPVVLATIPVIVSEFALRYCDKYIMTEELRDLMKEYFQGFNDWSLKLYDFSLNHILPDHVPEVYQEDEEPKTTPISGHKFKGRKLVPPMMNMPGGPMTPLSWSNDRMPESLWSVLLSYKLGREESLNKLRWLGKLFDGNDKSDGEVTFTSISKMDTSLKAKFLTTLFHNDEVKEALSSLRLIKEFPGREYWMPFLTSVKEDKELLQDLAEAVLLGMDQTSDASNDSRWFKLLCKVLVGKMHLPSIDHVKRVLEYPNFDEEGMVQSFVRASEMMLDQDSLNGIENEWIPKFWRQCYDISGCIAKERTLPTQLETAININPPKLSSAYNKLSDFFHNNIPSTGIEAKYDSLLGIGFFMISIAEDILANKDSSSLNLLGLRTMSEGVINLKYLVENDSEELWGKYRDYGSGQAKLNTLKQRERSTIPHYIPEKELRLIANEDKWEEFVTVDIGDWAGDNLRQRAIKTEMKEFYEDYYSWPSSFAHVQWAAIRYLNYDNCINPLHRHHRIPISPRTIKTVKYDIEIMLHKTFEIISNQFNTDELTFEKLFE